MPRPMRARFLRAPGRSASSLSFIAQSSPSPSSLAVHHPHQMPHLGDHAPRLRSVGQLAHAADAVEAEPDQRLALRMLAANCAADLLDLDHFVGLAHLGLPALTLAQSAACSASPVSRRRPCSVDTLMLRRAATERGESWCLSASNVARTMLYGFDEPSDFATTSCMPSVSNTARIGPPAMMPVPGGAARRKTFPAPWRPCTSWCSVRPSRSGTRMRPRLAASVALRIASGTSRALPCPKPTRPFSSPTTTSAANPKRRPPFTTLATRLMWTSLSVNSLSSRSRWRGSRAMILIQLVFPCCAPD